MDLPIATSINHKLTRNRETMMPDFTSVLILFYAPLLLFIRMQVITRAAFIGSFCGFYMQNHQSAAEGAILSNSVHSSTFYPFKVFFSLRAVPKRRAKNSDTFGHKLPCNFPRLLSPFLCRPCMLRQ